MSKRLSLIGVSIMIALSALGIFLLPARARVLAQTDTPTPTSTPTSTPTATPTPRPRPTSYYSGTPAVIPTAQPPPEYDWLVIPGANVGADDPGGDGGGHADDLVCPDFPPVPTFEAIVFEDLEFPTFTMEPISPAVPSWSPISLPVPGLPQTHTFDVETTTVTVTLPFSLVFEFSTITETWQPLIDRSYDIRGDVEEDVLGGGGGYSMAVQSAIGVEAVVADDPAGDLRSMTLAGYTAEQMASELVSGMDTTLSYVRAIQDIGVLGPTAATILIGLGWITFVTFGKFLFKAVLVVIDLTVALLRLVIDVIKAILAALDLIPFV